MKIEHPAELLKKPEAVLLINLLEQAAFIVDDNTENYFLDSPNGIYLKGSITPLIVAGKKYYPRSKYGNSKYLIVPETALQQKEDIVDESDKVVLSYFDIKHRPNIYTDKPILPISAMNVCYSIIIDYLFNYCKHARGFKINHITDCIKTEYQHTEYQDLFEDKLTDSLDELHEFIKRHDWNIYFHQIKGTTLIIERYVDWRIYAWTEMQFQKQEDDDGEKEIIYSN